MQAPVTIQGRELTHADIDFVREFIAEHPAWSRRRLSIALSTAWGWRNSKGALKDMACRSLLVKLHEREYIALPARRQIPTSRMTARQLPDVAHDTSAIGQLLSTLRPLRVVDVHRNDHYEPLYSCLLSRYHYLGYKSPVGENIKYLVVDRGGRPLACLLFGSSAWSCASRDAFIGWDSDTRRRNIHFTTNNARFLIFPWVRVPHLASHVLALVSRRITQDWMLRYGHSVYLLESFVDRMRFTGTCYRAANWRHVGETRGRGRNDRYTQQQVPVKSVFVYTLTPDYRSKLHQ
jgi:hypothetical protein